ncbi:MAG: DNA polymerase III subunit delta' [Vicinamibacteraceae bacterium]
MPFRDLKGHRAQQDLLARAILRQALPQSLVFAGPEGVGKRLVALGVAQRLNCLTAAADGDACGTCSACRRIGNGTHPDVLTIPGSSVPGERKVDTVREQMSHAAYRPFEGRRRVFIFDDADELQPVVQNVLLKTLEEPAPSSQFILVTARPEGLLPTVRSRCQQLRFGRLDVDDVAAMLVERQQLTPMAAREIAFAADGSPGRAFADASALGESVRALAERIISGAESSPIERLRLGAALAEPDRKTKRAPGTKAAGERDMLRERLDALGVIVRDLGIEAAGGDRRWQSRTPDPRLADLARRLGPMRLAHAYSAVEEARQALDRNVSFKTVADWVALEL